MGYIMSFRSLILCLLLIQFHPISVFSAASGKVKLYDDFNCNTPSTINPTVSLPLSVCLVTTGGESLIVAELPPCSKGTASLIYYQDTACGVSTTNAGSSIFAEDCMQLAAGTDIYNAKSVMFSCNAVEDNPQPTSTSTAVVSAIAGVATGSTNDNGAANSTPGPTATSTDHSEPKSTTFSATSAQTGAITATSTGHSESKSTTLSATSAQTGASAPKSSTGTTSSGSSGTTNNAASTTSSKPSSNSGLGSSNVIALGVGLGIGVPTIAIML